MALTQEQQTKLLEAYRQGKASGQTKEQSIASVKDYLLKSGQYDSAAAAYAAPAAPVSPEQAPSPAAPRGAQGGAYESNLTGTSTAPTAPLPSQNPPLTPGNYASQSGVPSSRTTANGEIINPTQSEIDGFNSKFSTTKPTPTVTQQRTQEIQQNLMEGSINGKQNFADVDTFKRAYGYDQKPEAEKAILDKFWSSYAEKNAVKPVVTAPATPTPKPTKNDTVLAILNGQETPEMKADPSYPSMKAAADKANKYAAMSTDDLVGAIAGSSITEEQATLLSKINPAFAQKWESAKAQYKLNIDTGVANETAASLANSALGAEAGADGVTPEKYEDPIIKAISEQITALTNASAKTQAEKDAQALVNEKKAKIDELTQARDKIYEDLSKTHTGVPKSLLMAMAAEKAKPVNEQISTLTREANLALGQYNAAVEERQLAGDTAKTVASLNLEVAKRYTEVQEARAKALSDSMTAQKRDTKVETIDGRKKLIDMQTGKEIADIGPDITDKKYELKEIGGKQYFVDPLGNKMPALGEGQYDWKASAELAKEYAGNPQAKNFMETANQYNRMVALKSQFDQKKIAPGVFDIAVIKTMEKMLDPNSVVREGEFDNYLRAAGVYDKATAVIAKLRGGDKISGPTRNAILNAINAAYGSARESIQPFQDSFMKNVDAVNADPVRVFGGYWVAPKSNGTLKDLVSGSANGDWKSEYLAK